MTLRKLHFLSGLILAIFTGPHLFNHIAGIYGIDKHIEVMNAMRFIYRNVFVETILFLAVLIQIVSGLKLFRLNQNAASTMFEKLHLGTGLYLAFFLMMHVTAVFTVRLLLHLDTNFYFGAVGLNLFPFSLLFIPYYGLAILSFFGHIASIHHKKTRILFGLKRNTQSYVILGFGLVVTIATFYGLTDHFRGIEIPKGYKTLLGQ